MGPKAAKSIPTTRSHTQKDSRSKPKPAVKKPLSDADKLKRLFASLYAQIDGGHFANAVKTCDKILRIQPSDEDALQTKVFLLIRTEQYKSALALIDAIPEGEGFEFKKAYSLYRLHEESQAETLLETIKKRHRDSVEQRGALHLEAQSSYRRRSYQKALEQYVHLMDTAPPDSDEYEDILVNFSASQAHVDFLNSGYLRALDALPNSFASSLESAPPPNQGGPSLGIPVTVSAPSAPAAAEKKVRKSRVPKGVIPGVTPPPDPERWLKKSERSTFGQGGKRRKGAGAAGGATQGSLTEGTPTAGHVGKSGGKAKRKK